MYYTGIDLHKKTSYLTTIDHRGRIVKRADLPNEERRILQYFVELGQPSKIALESTCSWYWLYDLLTGNGFDTVLSNPVKTKAIAAAKIKNDKLDSHMLAQLLRADLIATVYVPSIHTRQLKELLRHRARLVQDAARMKNRIHALLIKNNCSLPFSDIFCQQGLLALSQCELPEYHQEQLQVYLRLYQQLRDQIEPLSETIRKLAKDNPTANLLMTIPGIGPLIALWIVAEIEDIARFPSYRNLASYAGLVPALDASAGKHHLGRITKQGSAYLRSALVEAAQCIPRMRKCRLRVTRSETWPEAIEAEDLIGTPHIECRIMRHR